MPELTEEHRRERLRWLQDFIDKINTQDNRGTASPYLVVVQSLEYAFWGETQLPADKVLESTEGDEPGDGGVVGFNHYNYKDMAWFFTHAGAAEHLRQNKHNYNEPRTFIKHCFRSPEMQTLLEAVAAMVGKEYKRK